MEVPDDGFEGSVTRLPEILDTIHPRASLRPDPRFQRSAKCRLVFVQLERLPLFWRLDLDVFCRSILRDDAYDVDNPHAHGGDWSLTHSVLMNAIAAVKALLRNRDEVAEQLLVRGFHRVGLAVPQTGTRAMILHLAQDIAARRPETECLA